MDPADLSVVINGGTYKRRLTGDLAAKLAAAHHAVRVDFDAKGKAAKERAQRCDLERLEPFRDAYFTLSGPQRAALLANIISYVTGRSRRGIEIVPTDPLTGN